MTPSLSLKFAFFQQILSMITDCAWDSKKMRTEVHDWVHKLADHCRAVSKLLFLLLTLLFFLHFGHREVQ